MQRPTLLVFLVLLLVATACEDPVVVPEDDAGAAADAGRPSADAGPGSCLETPEEGPVEAVFALPRDGTEPFFDLPWPNDLRRQTNGRIDMTGFPANGNPYIREYLDAIDATLDGFGTNGAVYFRFSREISGTNLPTNPTATTRDGSVAFLIDVDPDSPERGTRHPAVVYYQECPTRFWSAHTLAIRPLYGVPLASARRYAAVVTRDVLPRFGGTFARSADFEALLGTGGDAQVQAARSAYGDAFDVIDAAGVPRDELLSVSVFTTQDAIGETIGIRDWMVSDYPAPQVDADTVSLAGETPLFQQVTGTYGPVPVFQEGEIPYVDEGGRIEVDADGAPTVHSEYRATFTASIPTSDMPAGGYPVVLYAHGTGGDHATFVRNDTAVELARRGFAAIGINQIHHGARNPTESDPSVLFFNIPNPDAARDNNRQSALDVVQQARLVAGFTLPTDIVDRGGEAVVLDPDRVFFMGHSQGGLNGPLFMAIDDTPRAGVLSAASAVITPSLIEKVEPVVIPAIVTALLMLPGGGWEAAFEREGFVYEHPIATLLQMWLEAADGSNYAHLIFESPRAGFAPKSVLMTEGLLDEYSPPTSIEALAGSMYVPQVEPVHARLDALFVRSIASTSAPVTANVASGMATAGLLQFPDDGHFAIFNNDTASQQVFGFFESLYEGGPGVIPAPVME